MDDYKPVSTPMTIGCKLWADDESPDVDQNIYRFMIGSLLYLTTSRLDIMLAVRLVARYQSTPKQSHLLATKRIFRYLKGTIGYGLWYLKGKDFTLTTYTYVDWASYVDD